jgi:hypothetical protein
MRENTWCERPGPRERRLTDLDQHLNSDMIRYIERFSAPREVKSSDDEAVS